MHCVKNEAHHVSKILVIRIWGLDLIAFDIFSVVNYTVRNVSNLICVPRQEFEINIIFKFGGLATLFWGSHIFVLALAQ